MQDTTAWSGSYFTAYRKGTDEHPVHQGLILSTFGGTATVYLTTDNGYSEDPTVLVLAEFAWVLHDTEVQMVQHIDPTYTYLPGAAR